MGRYKEAPIGFNCPYKNACPHLDMSTQWAKRKSLGDSEKGDRRIWPYTLYRTFVYVVYREC